MDIKERIIALADQRGWTEEDLARESKLTLATISLIYKGSITPSFSTMKMLCDAFGITLSQFFYEDIEILYSEEQDLLKRWNLLSGEQKKKLIKIVDKLFGSISKDKKSR